MTVAIYNVNGETVDAGSKELKVPWTSEMHRGYSSGTVHENTLAAFHRAWLNGADWIEADARLSGDDVYVVNHDATITVGGVTYTIAEETAETLTALVLSTDSTYGECRLPTLESVLKLCLYTGMNANIDCKAINAETLAQLVVDCGMSGRVAYANLYPSSASPILSVDPNAGFIFSYNSSNLTAWANVLDYHTRQRSYAWSGSVSYEALEATRALGFKYLQNEVNSTTNMHYAPDMIEFKVNADCHALNKSYLQSLALV